MYASRLGGHICSYLSIILWYMYDIDNAQIGLKGLTKVLSKDKINKLIEAMDLLGPSYLPEGIKVLIEIIKDFMKNVALLHIRKSLFYL